MGDPDIHDRQMSSWAAAMAALSTLPNVVIKVRMRKRWPGGLCHTCSLHMADAPVIFTIPHQFSGMPQEDGDNWTEKDFEPYFKVVWNLFGPDRMVFGGNW